MAVTFKSVTAASGGGTITLPSHNIGDVIVLIAGQSASLTPPSAPAAGGTVPTWNTITANTGSNYGTINLSIRSGYAIATATNHTSGTWTGADRMLAVCLSGVNLSDPIGGAAEADGGSNTLSGTCLAPAITLSDTTGDSVLLHFFFLANAGSSWVAAPSGYTDRQSTIPLALLTKNTTTTSPSIRWSSSTGTRPGRGGSIEIKATKPNQFFQFF